ncbi:MAG: DEAD/DEAH box helicase [Pseudobdellovibrionaceae bacterium]
MQTTSTFSDFLLNESTLTHLTKIGFTVPTPIQVLAIPEILLGFDVMAQAQTGTGKTAAFTLPTLNKITATGLQVMVLAPTRELAQQVSEEFSRLGQGQNVKVATVVGGNAYHIQLEALKKAQVLVATPGRLHDLLRTSRIKIDQVHTVILDEADKMLDMGFATDLEAIFAYLPKEKQTLLFSATFPESIRRLAAKNLKPDHKKLKVQNTSDANLDVEQSYSVVRMDDKDAAICRWIDYNTPIKTIVFCEMKKDADRLATTLTQKGYPVMVLHGDTEQRRREFVMQQFKVRKTALLIATDIAARGLDVSDVSHVVNYQIPYQMESYVHRIGRTGRAGKKGSAFSLVTPGELRYFLSWSERTRSQLIRKEIPTLSGLKTKVLDQLFQELITMDVPTDLLLTVSTWEEKHTLHDLTAALLHKMMQQKNIQGPEVIAVKETSFRTPRPPQTQRGGRSPYGGGGGYRRDAGGESRSSGGYRGGNSGGRSEGGRSGGGYRRDDSSGFAGPAAGEGKPPFRRSGGGGGAPARSAFRAVSK